MAKTETELWLHELRRGFISLEERDANVEGAGRITLQDLFQRGALRQRPRRIIVGEVRGKEAMDMLHAMTSGHDGSLTTLHASGPRMALSRLEVLAMSGDANLAPHVVRQMVGSGVDLVVHLSTFRLRGDGYFSGGAIGREERLRLIDLIRSTAKDNGRDVAFDVTRWGSKDLTAAQVEAHAADQVTRLVVGPASLDPQVQRDDLTAFAGRVGLI